VVGQWVSFDSSAKPHDVIPSAARNLLFYVYFTKQQIPRLSAPRNDIRISRPATGGRYPNRSGLAPFPFLPSRLSWFKMDRLRHARSVSGGRCLPQTGWTGSASS
jgi:hypothetical protein